MDEKSLVTGRERIYRKCATEGEDGVVVNFAVKNDSESARRVGVIKFRRGD